MSVKQATVGELIARRPSSRLHRGQSADGRPVVLKIVEGADEAGELARVEREHAIVSTLSSPSAVATYGVTTIEGRAALLREDFGGVSLDSLIGAPLAVDRFLRLAIGVARALADVHAAGVVHRDVKPSNLIADEAAGIVKLTDFGVASAPFLPMPAISDPVGTLPYMAPEQTGRLHRKIDARADLYAMGISFYQLLTGSLPFEGRDPLEWIHCHLARTPLPPSALLPSIPSVVSSLVLVLLEKAPEERYQSADGVRADLERCLREYTAERRISSFRLRESDIGESLELPGCLYGRERELRRLESAFEEVVRESRARIVLVTGPSGAGKSSLVRELHRPVTARDGAFASGKFEALRRHVPYVAFASAIDELVDRMLGFGAAQLEALKAAVGGRARVLVDTFPRLSLLFGPLPEPAPLGPAESQNRFQLVFRAFLRAVALQGRPLALFLDDMQWADPASLSLLEGMMGSVLPVPLLLVLAYRDNEVDAAHPFALAIGRLRAAGAVAGEVAVGPLDDVTVTRLVADTLHTSEQAAAPLARVVAAKTAGNPFFVHQFLVALRAEGLLRFDHAASRWVWNVADVEARGVTNNVVDLLIGRLAELPDDARDAVRLASCIGTHFDLDTLAIVRRVDPTTAAMELGSAVEQGLLLVGADLGRTTYSFRHDRVQQAAYAIVPSGERAAIRLGMARLLLAGFDEEEVAANLFDIVNHLDAGLPLVEDPEERQRARVLNERAGRRARASTAYALARTYLETAASLLPDDAWATRHEETFALELEVAECEYLDGAFDAARARFDVLLARARDELDRARVLYLQMRLFQVAGDYRGAANVAVQSFGMFGLSPPTTPDEAQTSCATLQAEAEALLAGTRVADLVDRPLLTDARLRALADLLESSGPPIYMVRPELFPWITLQLLLLSVRHGNCEASCYAYGIYALMRAAAMGDVDGGIAFAELAIALNEKLGDVRLRGCMLHLLGDHVNFWKRPFASDLPILERGFQSCLDGGDLIYSSYIAFQSPWHAFEAGLPLEDVWSLAERYVPFAARTNAAVHRTIRLEQQFVRDLQGLTSQRGTFEDGTFDEAEAIATIEGAQFGCGVVYRHIMAMIARYTYGDLDGAIDACAKAEPELGSAFSMPMYTSFVFYRALVSAARASAPLAADDARRERLAVAEADLASLTAWARSCPENFEDKVALVTAEIARATGRARDAIAAYERAIDAADASTHVHVQALACELAARFYAESGAPSVATPLYEEAVRLYRRWGAVGKAAHVEELQPRMGERRRLRSSFMTTTSGTTTTRVGTDLLSVVKASQSISEEMILPRLLERLMSIVIESAGARRGVLLLRDEKNAIRVAGEARIEGGGAASTDVAASVPMSVVHYVERTLEPVIVEDATLPHAFSADTYLAGRRARSLLCMPIMRHRELSGMFYLENDLVAHAFSSERLGVLEILASQTAISIDNARLFTATQNAVAARDEFLSLASHELKTPLTPLKLKVQSLAASIAQGKLRDMPEERLLALARTIDAQVARLAALIETILDVALIHTGRLRLDRQRLDLSALVREIVERRSSDLTLAGCVVAVDAPEPVVGSWDPARVEQILTNVLGNATRHARGSPVTITVRAHAGGARMCIEDTGPGIAADDLTHIFDRFSRRDRDVVAGLGLGLFIVRELVEAHGGTIAVDSVVGSGTRFSVDLPGGGDTRVRGAA